MQKKELGKWDFDALDEALLTQTTLLLNSVTKYAKNFGVDSEITRRARRELERCRELREMFRKAHTAWVEYD